MKQIVICGNPVDGLGFYGPFDTYDEAAHWAEREAEGDWWISNINSVEKTKQEEIQNVPKIDPDV